MQSLGDSIGDLLKQTGIAQELKERKVISSWVRLMGPVIGRHTLKVELSNGKMKVALDHAAMRQELLFAKESILKKLNDEAGEKIVKDIYFC